MIALPHSYRGPGPSAIYAVDFRSGWEQSDLLKLSVEGNMSLDRAAGFLQSGSADAGQPNLALSFVCSFDAGPNLLTLRGRSSGGDGALPLDAPGELHVLFLG